LSLALANVEIDKDKLKMQSMHKRLERLKAIKLEIERHHEDKERLRQIEIFKRVQLQHFLQQQIEEKRLKSRYDRELRIEAERNELLDRLLKEKNEEKEQLLREIEGIGKGVDDEIERALIKQTLERVNMRDDDEQVSIRGFDAGDDQVIDLDSVKVKQISNSIVLDKDGSSNVGASTHDLQTLRDVSFTAEQYATAYPSSIRGNLKDSFSELEEANLPSKLDKSMDLEVPQNLKKESIKNELDAQNFDTGVPEAGLTTPPKTPKRLDDSHDEDRVRTSPSSRTEKKLRQVNESDMDVGLKDVSKLVLSNLVQISKIYEVDEEKIEEKIEEEYLLTNLGWRQVLMTSLMKLSTKFIRQDSK
jgi:hypothetical protein